MLNSICTVWYIIFYISDLSRLSFNSGESHPVQLNGVVCVLPTITSIFKWKKKGEQKQSSKFLIQSGASLNIVLMSKKRVISHQQNFCLCCVYILSCCNNLSMPSLVYVIERDLVTMWFSHNECMFTTEKIDFGTLFVPKFLYKNIHSCTFTKDSTVKWIFLKIEVNDSPFLSIHTTILFMEYWFFEILE